MADTQVAGSGSLEERLHFREILNSLDPMQLMFPPFGPKISQELWEYRWQGCLRATLTKESVHLMEKEANEPAKV